MILNTHVDTEFNEPSVAVYVTVVVPMEKLSPGLSVEFSVTEPELSEAVGGVHFTTAVWFPASVLTTVSLGQLLMVGSATSMDKYAFFTQLQAISSVYEDCILISPTLNSNASSRVTYMYLTVFDSQLFVLLTNI